MAVIFARCLDVQVQSRPFHRFFMDFGVSGKVKLEQNHRRVVQIQGVAVFLKHRSRAHFPIACGIIFGSSWRAFGNPGDKFSKKKALRRGHQKVIHLDPGKGGQRSREI